MNVIRLTGATLMAAALWNVSAPAASAGTYVVEACRTKDGPAPTTAWRAVALGDGVPIREPYVLNGCLSGGPMMINDLAFEHPLQVGVQWGFTPPRGTTIEGFRLQRHARQFADAGLYYRVRAGGTEVEVGHPDVSWEFGDYLVSGELVASELRESDVAVEVFCDMECHKEFQITIARAAVTVRDEISPELVGVPSGTLVSGGSLQGVVDVHVGFQDVGGGVATAELTVDGRTRNSTPVGGPKCRAPYVASVPCAAAGQVELRLDTADLAPGHHSVEVELRDVAGNRTTVGPYGVWVRTPTSSATTEEPAPGATSATAAPTPSGTLSITGKRTRRVKFVSTKLAGTLAGTAIAGQRVEVCTRPLRGGSWSAPTVVTTDAKGRFSLSLPRGPSREVRLAYGASVQTVKLIVAAPVRLKVNRRSTRNGRSVRFSGTVPGTDGARTRVELQAWAGKWVPFKTAALRNGRFNASYRFTSTYSKTRYRFRAVIHDDDDFPYAGGTSPEVKVVVRP
ncbi:hypothetical protein OJ997_01810 [Solirubrobacter phytolaccae]|uniref:Carboxypeptidase regulatory-like domain-containing protein n=1 Tax=Solirubrobacter phytolaccae TaxID=1404360 RepID=A0A9X3S5J8_9ACTN|nr:hypothetical protein [Solirubrobacter phytolaccae]MDA0179014.1 hypothetical protein [Solirubrobacter phytolaccae]